MKTIRVINEELIDLREFKKPNFVFCTNEYSNSEDFCTFHEQINPFDLYYENKEKGKEIERLNNIINELEKWLKMIPKYFMDKRSLNNGVYIEQGMQKQIDLTLDKLKELKESDEK